MDRNRGGRPRHPDVLTPAEWRVLEALLEGGTNAEIGARLGLSLDTVKYHISNMLAKLELRDRRALASWRPEEPRGRLRGAFAVPAAIAAVARPIVWVGAATAAVAGVVVGVVTVVALVAVVLVVAGGERDESLVATPLATSTAPPTAGAAVAASAVPGLCATPTDPTCIRAVYLGAPDDYAQVADIPADALLTLGSDGRYVVERGQQVTVVTTAPLRAGWTRFWLDRTPLEFGEPSPTSFEQLIQPVGTTYTFTVTDDERGASVITFDLKAARPFVRPRPDGKPELGDVVVTTVFSVPALRYNLLDTTGAARAPGSYAFLTTAGDLTSAITNFSLYPALGVELRIHSTGGAGSSRAAFYSTVKIGDSFDYRTNGPDCGFRFRITSVPTTPVHSWSFGIEYVYQIGGRCGGLVDDPAAAKDVDFVWLVPAGYLGDDGVRIFLHREPAGKGTYRLYEGSRYVVDVPAGMRIVAAPPYSFHPTPPTPHVTSAVALTDVDTGASIYIDTRTGEVFRRDSRGDVNGRLDQIVQAIRVAD